MERRWALMSNLILWTSHEKKRRMDLGLNLEQIHKLLLEQPLKWILQAKVLLSKEELIWVLRAACKHLKVFTVNYHLLWWMDQVMSRAIRGRNDRRTNEIWCLKKSLKLMSISIWKKLRLSFSVFLLSKKLMMSPLSLKEHKTIEIYFKTRLVLTRSKTDLLKPSIWQWSQKKLPRID